MLKPNSSNLLSTYEQILKNRESSSARRKLTIAVVDAVDFSSNDFLSLSKAPYLRTAYLTELQKATESNPLGSGGSRLLDGNSPYALGIERDLADFYGAASGLLFNSGFDANSGIFSCLPQPGDAIIYDEYIHASVHEGMRLSRAAVKKAFNHNDIEAFQTVLQGIIASDHSFGSGDKNIFIAIEAVYSMDGDVAPVKELLESMQRLLPRGNGHLMVDEAHATGVYGSLGRGLVCDLGIESQIFLRLHTFGKALSSGGAIVLCHSTVRDYLINYARSLIYTTAMGLPTLAMIKTVHALMRDGTTEEARQRLWQLVAHFHDHFRALPPSGNLEIAPSPPASPIFSLCTSQPRSLARHCQAAGFMVRPIVPPTVPEGTSRVRVCLHSGNTIEEIDRFVRVVQMWIKSAGKDGDTKPSEIALRPKM